MKHKTLFIVIYFVLILFLGSFVHSADAADIDIAQQYAPIFYFEKDETCYPVDVSYHIENSYLYNFTQEGVVLGNASPTEEELSAYSTNDYQYFYLDNQKGTVDDNGIITDYQNKQDSLGYTVYPRVYSSGGATVVQYWMFYAFNKGELNQHEGDWEMVQIVISDETAEVMYSQHHSGQRATWDQVEREGDHIKVYVARGSHANYLRSYSGKLGIGMASDIVGDNGRILQPDDYELELLESQGWLNFSGRWGEVNSIEEAFLGKIGPQGPKYRGEGAMWNDPLSWGDQLQQADDTIFLLEWFLYHFVTIFIILTAVSIGIIAFRIYRRHKKYGLGPRIVSVLYIDGFNLTSIGNILCFVGIILAIFGLLYNWYGISLGVDIGEFGTQDMIDLISIDGVNGVQISFPSLGGAVPVGSFVIPFSLIIGVGLLLMILATVGIATSRKLGRKYIWRGIKLILPIILILIMIMALGMMIPSSFAGGAGESTISSVFGSLSSSPFGGQETIYVSEGGASGQIDLEWGLGLGGQLLLIAGVVLLVAGVLENIPKKTFFEGKMPEQPRKIKKDKQEKTAEKGESLSSEESKRTGK